MCQALHQVLEKQEQKDKPLASSGFLPKEGKNTGKLILAKFISIIKIETWSGDGVDIKHGVGRKGLEIQEVFARTWHSRQREESEQRQWNRNSFHVLRKWEAFQYGQSARMKSAPIRQKLMVRQGDNFLKAGKSCSSFFPSFLPPSLSSFLSFIHPIFPLHPSFSPSFPCFLPIFFLTFQYTLFFLMPQLLVFRPVIALVFVSAEYRAISSCCTTSIFLTRLF